METPRPFGWTEVVVLLSPDHEVCSDAFYVMESLEVIVATVENVERVLFVGNNIHRIHVVNPGLGDMEEGRNRCLNVI